MNLRPATPADAAAIAALVRSFEALLVVDPSRAQPFWDAMSAQAHAANLASPRFRYVVAEVDGTIAGFIAMRDGTHLFNLFVARTFQGQGIGRRLWEQALSQLPSCGAGLTITVNASPNAIPVYGAFGFRAVGGLEQIDGVAFVPMRWQAPPIAT